MTIHPMAASPRKRIQAALLHPAAKAVVFTLALMPLSWLAYRAATDTLGANPAEALIRGSGDWVLRMLCLTLAVTPLRQISGVHALARFRRMLGLFAFAYGQLHFMAYAGFDMGLDLAAILADIPKRPFVLVGSAALLLMLPLAATSFNRAIKALGAGRWQALHRSVYAIVLLGLLHFFWMRAAKHNFSEVAVYAAVIALLLGWRLVRAVRAGWRPRSPRWLSAGRPGQTEAVGLGQ
jgi:sulfoxide reductase heme-binding subunit YedZ